MTNIPTIPGIVDLVALQQAVVLTLLSDERLQQVPILPELRMLMDNDIAVDALWTLPRAALKLTPTGFEILPAVRDVEDPTESAGPVGCGLLVEMVEGQVVSNNVSGPPLKWQVKIVAFENRNVNLTVDVGQFIMAEQLVQIVVNCLHLQNIYPFGTLTAASNALSPARDWETLKPGITCWRAVLEVTNGRIQTPRSQNVAITFAGGLCTLACPDGAAHILYTLDGSPAVQANPSSQQYVAPFGIQSGDLVVAASWKQGALPSSVTGQIAP